MPPDPPKEGRFVHRREKNPTFSAYPTGSTGLLDIHKTSGCKLWRERERMFFVMGYDLYSFSFI